MKGETMDKKGFTGEDMVVPDHHRLRRFVARVFREYGIFLALLAMVVVLSFATRGFFSINNALNVLRQVSVNGILAIAVTFVMVTAGIDLSLGSVLAFAGVVAASVGHVGDSVLLAVLIGLAAGGVCGLINGAIIATTRVPPFIVTLGMMTIARGAALTYSNGRPVIELSDEFEFIGQGYLFGIPTPIYVLALVGAISYVVLHHS